MLFAPSKDVLSEFLQASFVKAQLPPIADLNGKYVFYEIHLNKPEYDYIVQNTLYSKDGQTAFLPNRMRRSASRRDRTRRSPYGAIEVKAAWKQIGAGDDPTKFYTVDATLIDPVPPGTRSRVTMGLVGLHIITRTEAPRSGCGRPSNTSPMPRTLRLGHPTAAPAGREPLQLQRPYPDSVAERLRLQPPNNTPVANPKPTQITRVLNNDCDQQPVDPVPELHDAGEARGDRLGQLPPGDDPVALADQYPQAGEIHPVEPDQHDDGNLHPELGNSCMGCHNFATDGRHAHDRRRPISATCSRTAQPTTGAPAMLRSRRQ